MPLFKKLIWAGLLLLITLCWLDYQYLSEGTHALNLPEQRRRLLHIIILILILPAGYLGWYRHPVKWLKNIWVFSYAAAIIIIGSVGVLQLFFSLFGASFLDSIMSFRIFFCSPVPYLAIYIFSLFDHNASLQANK